LLSKHADKLIEVWLVRLNHGCQFAEPEVVNDKWHNGSFDGAVEA